MVAYKLDPYYCDELLNPTQWDGFLKQEIIWIAFENKYDAVIKDDIVIKKLQFNKLQLKLQLVATYCKNFFNIKIYN